MLNSGALLSDCPQFDLYKMSRRAGLNMSWLEWSGGMVSAAGQRVAGVGGPLVLEPGVSFPLGIDKSVGSSGSTFSFSATISCTNTSAAPVDAKIIVAMLYDGFLTVTRDGVTGVSQLALSDAEVLSASQNVHAHPAMSGAPSYIGGGLWDTLGKVMSNAGSAFGALKSVAEGGKGVADYVGKKGGGLYTGGAAGASARMSLADRLAM